MENFESIRIRQVEKIGSFSVEIDKSYPYCGLHSARGCTPSYILHTHTFGTYLVGPLGGYLPCKKYYKVMVFNM